MRLANLTYPALKNTSTGKRPGVAGSFFFSIMAVVLMILDRSFSVPHSEQQILANQLPGPNVKAIALAVDWVILPIEEKRK